MLCASNTNGRVSRCQSLGGTVELSRTFGCLSPKSLDEACESWGELPVPAERLGNSNCGFYRWLSSSSTSVLEFKIWSAISKGTYAFLFIQCFFRKHIALRTNASAPFEQLLSSTHNYKKHFSVSQVSVVGTNSRRICEREKEAAEEIAVWTLLFFAGCVPHTGSIWSCQAKGPGFAFCWNLSDSFPHVVPWGEFRDISRELLRSSHWCYTCTGGFLQFYSSEVLSWYFSINSFVGKRGRQHMWGNLTSTFPPCVCT